MNYRSLREAVNDLERNNQLVRVTEEVDPFLEMAEIHRRVYDIGGPAILYENIKGSPFQAVSNLYGTHQRTEFLFRNTLRSVARVIELKADISQFGKKPWTYVGAASTAFSALPWKQSFKPAVMAGRTKISDLPQIVSWPEDGGAFITLPQVLTQAPGVRSILQSNLGMYRIQMSGNDYVVDEEVGMHYQLHRGIGIHHKAFLDSDLPFKASIFVGGPPAHALAAIFPLPENLSELTFAGMLGGRRFRYHRHKDYVISNDADFVITGIISKSAEKAEGPFGDHLGYYSLKHDFPVMRVYQVFHRRKPLWHFTVVGRPPQEDSSFGYLIHKLVGPLLPQEFPGVKEVNAVDVAGVHPLLLAIGSERYMPFRDRRPEEILTQANHLLGSGQTSLAKYLLIAADADQPVPSSADEQMFIRYVLERIDWTRDLHFFTRTTMDTLDYSGSGWNEGSKVVMACYGEAIRTLSDHIRPVKVPTGFGSLALVDLGILGITAPPFNDYSTARKEVGKLIDLLEGQNLSGFPLIVLADDTDFLCRHYNNFLWVAFTRSNPSHDIYGVGTKIEYKHWGCDGPLIIDARIKPHHAPALVTDPEATRSVDRLFATGGSLAALKT